MFASQHPHARRQSAAVSGTSAAAAREAVGARSQVLLLAKLIKFKGATADLIFVFDRPWLPLLHVPLKAFLLLAYLL